ncbi:MAG TPA: hypothetical protein VI757_12970 [Bacteroidia bacterium]|nr:hypothetical protein [Bacteroidia bacterium]
MTLVSLSFILLAQTCSKEITLPDSELKKIFGKWEWIETSGGFAGKIMTPAKTGTTDEIEFSTQGIFQEFKNGKLQDKKRFSITKDKSILKGDSAYIISFSSIDSSFRRAIQKQSVSFTGSDTLLLNEECFDCFSSIWVRKK